MSQPGFTCPICLRTTYHPDDIANRYCPCCGGPGLPKPCEHDLIKHERAIAPEQRR